MQHSHEFRLSELYLACRCLGARHVLTHEVLKQIASLAKPELTDAVMQAPITYGQSQFIPFRRNPIDLRFACALTGSLGRSARRGFIVCSDEAIGYMGALEIHSTMKPHYSLEECPRVPAVLEEHDIVRALHALTLPEIRQAAVLPDADHPDRLYIRLPAKFLTEAPPGKATPTPAPFKCRIFPHATPPESLTRLQLERVDAQTIMARIEAEQLMVCHHAGLQGLHFELVTPDFALEGRFPDLLGTPRAHLVHHTPVGLFHDIFKGLDNVLLTLPDETACALRDAVPWLKPGALETDLQTSLTTKQETELKTEFKTEFTS